MPSNVEIKARLRDPDRVLAEACRLADAEPTVIEQHDTFYTCSEGRLKLRRFPDGRGELIAYHRPDLGGPKTSTYQLYRTEHAADLQRALDASLVRLGEVRKTRRLLLVGRTRVHLDDVAGLGRFLELEVVLAAGDAVAEGVAEARTLVQRLGIPESDLISGAYIDLIRDSG
ncbi:MAG: class IV adenylate cyclase [Candidatus Krumholzibacteriia bacterium]